MNCLILAIAVALLDGGPTEVAAGPHPLVRGTLRGGQAYTLGLTDWLPREVPVVKVVADRGQRLLLRAPVADGRPTEFFNLNGQRDSRYWPSRGMMAPVRWQILGDELFFVHYSRYWMTLGSDERAEHMRAVRDPDARILPCPLGPAALEHSRFADLRHGDAAGGIDQRPLTHAPGYRRNAGFLLGALSNLFDGASSPRRNQPLPPADRLRVHFDFWLEAADRAELYIIRPDRLTRHLLKDTPARTSRVDAGEFVPGWDGPFYVAADAADRHFVAPGGRVFTLPADAKPGSALVKTWDRDPILALVHDSDAGKSYAFTRTHYFHLTAKPDPKPHGIKAFPGATADEALDTVAKCGRVIRGLK